jgi:hypothetical protein
MSSFIRRLAGSSPLWVDTSVTLFLSENVSPFIRRNHVPQAALSVVHRHMRSAEIIPLVTGMFGPIRTLSHTSGSNILTLH